MKNSSRLRRHRRRMIVILALALVAVAWVVYAMVADFRSRPVSYSVERIRPMFDQLCPGDTMRYEVSLSVTQVPVVLEITETWCRTGEAGICARALTTTYTVPVLEPRAVYSIANRTVPESDFFRPGDQVEMLHATTDGDNVTGYIVGPVTIRDNCGERPEGGAGGN